MIFCFVHLDLILRITPRESPPKALWVRILQRIQRTIGLLIKSFARKDSGAHPRPRSTRRFQHSTHEL